MRSGVEIPEKSVELIRSAGDFMVQSEVEFVEVGCLERSISLTKMLHKLKGGIVDQPKYRMAE